MNQQYTIIPYLPITCDLTVKIIAEVDIVAERRYYVENWYSAIDPVVVSVILI